MMSKQNLIPVRVGNLTLDGSHIYIQSMLSVPSTDIEGNVRQAKALEAAGCEILRVAIPDKAAVALIPKIKEAISIPLVADIHFDYRLALESLAAGIDKIRINPGNIGDDGHVREVARACAARGVPIRIGVNSGSVEKEILARFGGPTPEALVESGLYHVRLLENCDFNQIVVSLKSSDVRTMVAAYRMLAACCPYPLHLGVTEAGTERMGLIKSAAGIGSLLLGRHRRDHPRLPDRRPGAGGLRRPGYSQRPRLPDRHSEPRLLPDLRPYPHRPHPAGKRGRAAPPVGP